MELVNGVYYTPEDLARKREREAAAAARRDAAARDVAERVATTQVEVSDDRIRAVLTELLEPVIEAIENLEARVSVLEGAGGVENGAESGVQEAGEGDTPAEPVQAASEAGSADSGDVPPAPAKRTARKAVK